ncbi:MAG: peptide ABC transporter substrate-binding protein [Chloroflexota bacterium]|nr:peptide ABC transporter substrate-binding protein [Chloroflexota bacterium]
MTDASTRSHAVRTTAGRDDVSRLVRTLASGMPGTSRRDLVRVSAIATAAALMPRAAGAVPALGWGAATLAMAQDGEPETDVELSIPLLPFGQSVVLDPHRAPNWGPFWVMYPNVWGGLLRFDEMGGVVEDLAESYTVSDDGLVYTFKIRPDAAYANGTAVVAEHFVTSWRRALDPAQLSPMSEFMSAVTGFDAYVTGDSEEIGFAAIDDATVEITLSEPYSYFTSELAAFVWDVIDPAALEADGELALADGGTGPWRVTEFAPDERVVMEPNPNYYGGASPSLTRLTWQILNGPDAHQVALQLYRDDEAISADVSISLIDEVRADETLAAELRVIETPGSTRSLAMDFTKEPFNDVRVRRAFARAVDRERWATEIQLGTFQPATAFTPPVVESLSGYQAPEGLAYDPDAARQGLADAGFPDGEGFPEIVFYQAASDDPAEIERTAQFLTTIQDVLGITIRLDATLEADQIDQRRQDEGGLQLDMPWWWSVTETPQLLSYALRPGSQFMEGYYNWSTDLEAVSEDFDPGADAASFDEMVGQADIEQDEATRNDLYQQAEALALENAVYVPIGNWLQAFVQKPWLQGTRQGPWTGRLPVLFDADVVVIGREA